MNKAPIQERAMLVSLNISQWTARKRDRQITDEVTKGHAAASDSGNFNKLLLNKAALEGITKAVSAARSDHYAMTLAWGDNGDRIMAGSMIYTYQGKMSAHEITFDESVRELERVYPSLIQTERKRLGTMYNSTDYPASIRDRFSFRVDITALATADDFRVSLSTEHVEQIKRAITRTFEERQQGALKETWSRVREVLSKIKDRCADQDAKIYDSLIGNARELISILPALNFTDDPDLKQIGQDIDALLVPAERLRMNKILRKDTAKAADELLSKLPW